MGKPASLALVAVLLAGCGENTRKPDREPASPPLAEPARNPIRKGFTGEPPPGAAELPPPPPPLLSQQELEAARKKRPTFEEREVAQKELRELLLEFERKPAALAAEPAQSSIDRIRAAVIRQARQGRLVPTSAIELHQDYQYPNEPALADEKYKGRVAVLTGTVVPHNVADITDVYKIFERQPYVQDPLLLKTGSDLTFVRCRLAQPSLQKLADWEPIQVAGIVEGRVGGDVVLRQCVVLH